MKYKPSIREQTLETVVRKIFYMARRYANGRSTWAPDTIRECYWTLKANGIDIEKDETIKPPDKMTEFEKGFGFNPKNYLSDINL
jgi:hypothetical protein